MKILLDIDGVMIPAKSWQSYEVGFDGFGLFNKIAVENLNKIISLCHHPEIVLTTSHKNRFTVDQWTEIFQNRGVSIGKISKLEADSLEMSRKEEIYTWYLRKVHHP